MSFLSTLVGLVEHHNNNAQKQQHPGHAVAQSHPQAQQQLGVARSDGSNFQPMSNGQALVNNRQIYPAGTQEDDPNLPNMHPQLLQVHSLLQSLAQQPNMGASDGGNLQQFMGNNQSYGLNGFSNPGFTPLQNSGYGPGGNPQMYGHQNPQLEDNGYYWNQ